MSGTIIRVATEKRGTGDALSGILDRIEATIDAESAAFSAHQPVDLTDINHRKRQGLLELSRLVPVLPPGSLNEVLRGRLTQLSDKLERNRRILDIQLRAVREVSDIIAATIRNSESDGTYSMFAGWS